MERSGSAVDEDVGVPSQNVLLVGCDDMLTVVFDPVALLSL